MMGVVTRTGAGTGGLAITADGGWGTPLADGTGDLNLVGFTTGTSLTQVGGAAGYPVGTVPAQDLAYTGVPRIIEEPTNGPGVFNTWLLNQPVAAGATAVRNITTFHLTNVGDAINIPSGVGLVPLNNPRTSPAEGPHFECYSVDRYTPQEKIPVTLKDQFANVETLLARISFMNYRRQPSE